jgi:hypothetical protein
MKKLIVSIIAVLALCSMASASVLITANPLGAGKMGWLAAGEYDMNSQANMNMYGVGGFLGYGINGNLDLYAKLGYGINPSVALGLSSMNDLSMGLALKYTFINESQTAGGSSVSLAGVLGYQADTVTAGITGAGNTVSAQGDIGVGLIVSKIMVPWVPYGAAVYHSLNVNPGSVTGTRTEVAVGTQMLLSKNSAIVGEFSYNSFGGNVGSFTNNQLSLAYSAKI